jgi:hypothetical protein
MTDKEREEIALFRFGVISDLVGATRLEHGERGRRIKEKAAARWNIPHSLRTRISANTIRRWVPSTRRADDSSIPSSRFPVAISDVAVRWMKIRFFPWCACAKPSRCCRWCN